VDGAKAMSANTIEWHEVGYRNMMRSLASLNEEIQRKLEHRDRLANDIDKLRRQIARAKKLKKTSFDADKFAAD
jgi:hypothetical protein